MKKFERSAISVLSVCIILLIIEPFIYKVDWALWTTAITFCIGNLAVLLCIIYIE